MTYTTAFTTTESFTLTHAKHLSSKVTADMLRCLQLYGRPSTDHINKYGTELAYLLRDGYVEEYEFGFKQNEQRLLSWRYTVVNGSFSGNDDRPGKIYSGTDIASAIFFNFLTKNAKWWGLTAVERERIEGELPVKRTAGSAPRDGNGFWLDDRSYSSGGVSLGRKTFRPY